MPYNIGWHLSHHVDMGVPMSHLPQMHRELRASGWVPDGLEHRSYPALWRALASGPERPAPPPDRPALASPPRPSTTVPDGAVAEWTIAVALKATGLHGPGGSLLTGRGFESPPLRSGRRRMIQGRR